MPRNWKSWCAGGSVVIVLAAWIVDRQLPAIGAGAVLHPARRVQPLLSQALRMVAHATIRNRGTTVGSLVHADASAEMPVVLRLLDGTVTARSASGTRTIPAEDLYLGPLDSPESRVGHHTNRAARNAPASFAVRRVPGWTP